MTRRLLAVVLVVIVIGSACAAEPEGAPNDDAVEETTVTEASAGTAVSSDLAQPVEIARSFIAAHTALDEEAAMALVHPDAQIAAHGRLPRTHPEYAALFGWYEALRWRYEPVSCEAVELATQVRVDCQAFYNNVLSAAVGAENIPSSWEFFIEDGLIVEFTESRGPESSATFQPWMQWLRANHAADWPSMMRLDDAGDVVGGPQTTAEALGLFEIHAAQYYAEMTGQDLPETGLAE